MRVDIARAWPLALALALTFTSGSGHASARQQQPASPASPSEPHERLTMFIGTWTVAEFPPEADLRETCDWLGSGRRHVVCHSRWQTQAGPREGLSIFSYRPADGVYLYNGFRSGGAVQDLTGRVSADGMKWDFLGEEGTGTAKKRTKVRIERQADGGFRFYEQTATGDGPWTAEEIVTYRKVSPSGK